MLAFFGAPVAHEDDAERAVLSGLRIAAAIEEYGRDVERGSGLTHSADRLAVTEEVAMIPLWYGRSPFLVKPRLHGWWEYGKSWSSFADLVIDAPE